MNDWFEWKGTKCTDFGIHVLEQPPISIPEERTEQLQIYGRSGTLTKRQGDHVFNEFIATAECVIPDVNNLSAITSYLTGASRVTFANRPKGYYEARIRSQIDLNTIVRGRPNRRFILNFRCQPFFYWKNVDDIILTEGAVVCNPATVASEPKIVVEGTGDILLWLGEQQVELCDVMGEITLDSTLLEASSNGISANAQMVGSFPELKAGDNLIRWEGNVNRIKILPRWRDLA